MKIKFEEMSHPEIGELIRKMVWLLSLLVPAKEHEASI